MKLKQVIMPKILSHIFNFFFFATLAQKQKMAETSLLQCEI